MIIHGNSIGNMIGEQRPKRRRYPGEFAECPSCGGQMHHTAELCHACHVEHNNTFGAIHDPDVSSRRARFTLAMKAGWPMQELMALCRVGQLPTYEQILQRSSRVVIQSWWEKMG